MSINPARPSDATMYFSLRHGVIPHVKYLVYSQIVILMKTITDKEIIICMIHTHYYY